ncbi:hypothetical protein FUMI01_12640 [Flavobacterium sp. UMI-01]|nr:hypothetical protein FUMI01_12640 [Flavobacterium sp. UMI-01]
MSLTDLEYAEKKLLNELSYYKFGFYLKNVENGKSRYSLASISDKKMVSLMESAPKDDEFKKTWSNAVKRFTDFEDKNSFEIKEHRINYRPRFATESERNAYYTKYTKLSNDLKREKFDEYTKLHDDFNDKLNKMWLNRGWYLLSYYKNNNLLFPEEIMNYKDYEDITSVPQYVDLTKKVSYVKKRIKKLK